MERLRAVTSMRDNDFGNTDFHRVHFIGIGGVGMSGIASVAKKEGMYVSGSDLKESKYTMTLRKEGIDLFIGQAAENIAKANPDVVVVSSAIHDNNPELIAAKEAGLPIWMRAKMLAYVSRNYKVIACAGTHGKTTTSSMLSSALYQLGADPAFLVGGILDGFDTNARYGKGDYCVMEADESDGSFTYLDPYIAVITNVEEDHMDHYANLDEIKQAFSDFIKDIPEDGAAIVCGETDFLPQLARNATKANVIVYGMGVNADVKVAPGEGTTFAITMQDGEKATVTLAANPGVHNMLNAAAVITSLMYVGYSLEESVRAVEGFSGVRRRFDLVGKVDGVTIVDDYGHHPTEIAATIAAARRMGYKRIHVLFQPHRYSRTESLAAEFGPAFDQADRVTVMNIYSAGETPIPGITGKTVVDAVLAHDPGKDISWVENKADIVEYLADWLQDGDLLITMGAGDVTAMGPQVLDALVQKQHG